MTVQIFHSVLLAHCALFTNLCLQCLSEKGKKTHETFHILKMKTPFEKEPHPPKDLKCPEILQLMTL